MMRVIAWNCHGSLGGCHPHRFAVLHGTHGSGGALGALLFLCFLGWLSGALGR